MFTLYQSKESPLNIIRGYDNSVLKIGNFHIVKILLHRRKLLNTSYNTNILNTTVEFLLEIKVLRKGFFEVNSIEP